MTFAVSGKLSASDNYFFLYVAFMSSFKPDDKHYLSNITFIITSVAKLRGHLNLSQPLLI